MVPFFCLVKASFSFIVTGKDKGWSKTRHMIRERTHQLWAAVQKSTRKASHCKHIYFKWQFQLDATILYGYTQSIPPLLKTMWLKGRGEEQEHSLNSEHYLMLLEGSFPALWALQKGERSYYTTFTRWFSATSTKPYKVSTLKRDKEDKAYC